MRRYLLVLDMDLLALDDQLDLELINYLMTRHEQEPCEVVVLSLAGARQARLPGLELLLGARSGKFPVAPKPDHDLGAAAEHRMNLAVRHLTAIGCQASGLISDEDLLSAVRSETRGHAYDELILATGQDATSRLARALHLDPVHKLRRRWGRRLTVFPLRTTLVPRRRRPGFGRRQLGSGCVRNWAGATLSQVPWRKTGQTNLVTPWYV